MNLNNIFIIEDDQFFAKTFQKRLEKILGETNVEIHTFASVEDANPALKRTNPEIVFLDHFLAGINGVDAIPDLVKLLPKSEIVVVSAQKETSILDQALKSGASRYFRKDVLLMQNARELISEFDSKKSVFSIFWSKF
ncbi:MAG: response regulator [Crocinitomicaceae bacterium]